MCETKLKGHDSIAVYKSLHFSPDLHPYRLKGQNKKLILPFQAILHKDPTAAASRAALRNKSASKARRGENRDFYLQGT